MAERPESGAVSEQAVTTSSDKERVYCQVCGSHKVRRIFRKGYMQKKIYPVFGYFPWRCLSCGKRVMLRKRHRNM